MSREIITPSVTLEERYWAKVDVRGPHECWPWTAYTTADGHGRIFYGRRDSGVAVIEEAHRVGWTYANPEPAPDEMVVRHTCDFAACQNPAHWVLGTHEDNHRDMLERGRNRGAVGERNRTAKLTAADVVRIRALRRDGMKRQAVAEMFGVTPENISAITTGRNWSHIPEGELCSA